MHKNDLDGPFLWGISTASYQIEGSTSADGRSDSIWDAFCRQPGRVLFGHTGDDACDSYRRWREDIGLLKELGVRAYRFSIAWPRVQPGGRGSPNPKGLDYYRRLADTLREADIEPWAALYHWDLPRELEDAGGWPARDTAPRFAEYARICFEVLGASVRNWVTLNEPWCSAFLGYGTGEHAPGRRDTKAAFAAAHHLLLGHGLAVRACREALPGARIGIVINPAKPRPATARQEDIEASLRASVNRTGLWLDPLYGRGYPSAHIAAHGAPMPVLEGDLEAIAAPCDFVGVNYYNEDVVRAVPVSVTAPEGFEYAPSWQPKTAMGWDVVPEGLYRILEFMARNWPIPKLYVTENGAAYADAPGADGRIHDAERIDYYRRHIEAALRACEDGIPVCGYFAWTLMDNFEWAHGYDKRFGLVAVDRASGARAQKDSFYYYRDVVAGFRA